jgi:hypothetical protein
MIASNHLICQGLAVFSAEVAKFTTPILPTAAAPKREPAPLNSLILRRLAGRKTGKSLRGEPPAKPCLQDPTSAPIPTNIKEREHRER